MSKPMVAITGASSGIGEANARAFYAGAHPACQMLQNVLDQEMVVTPTRQEY